MECDIPYPELDTPAVLLDLGKLEANVEEMSLLATEAGVRLRPHTKVHQSAFIAKKQIEAGACGIEVGVIGQAEAMAKEGIDDILIAHPFYGEHKLEGLKRLINETSLKITVVVDMIEQAEAISKIGEAAGQKILTVIKIETGGNRYGVLPGELALNLAQDICKLPGIKLKGIYAHEIDAEPTEEGVTKKAWETASQAAETARMLKRKGIEVEHVSVGASSTFRATCRYLKEGMFPEINEIHPGNCVIGDIMYYMAYGNTLDTCALSVLTSVMSTSHLDHAVIDAGRKTFGAQAGVIRQDAKSFFFDGRSSHGLVIGRPDLWLGRLAAEVGWLHYIEPSRKLRLGDRLEIIPNAAHVVVNLHDKLYGVKQGTVETTIHITGRGWGS